MQNANLIKPNQLHIDKIKSIINDIFLEKDVQKATLFIKIPANIYQGLLNFSKTKLISSPLVDCIKKKFQKGER